MEVLEVILYVHSTLGSLSAQTPIVLFKFRLKVVLDNLVNGLNLTICLRMINRREVFLDVELVTEFSELLPIELRTIIENNLLRYAVSTYYCLLYKVLDFFVGDHGEQFGFGPLCEIIDYDHNILENRSRCW